MHYPLVLYLLLYLYAFNYKIEKGYACRIFLSDPIEF